MERKLVLISVIVILLTSLLTVAVRVQPVKVSGQPLGIISYWKFDEGSGNTSTDSVNGNHGTIHGATWNEGIVGNALGFDGIDDDIEIPSADNLVFGTNDFTIMAWIYPTAWTANGGLNAIVTKHNADEGSWLFRIAIDPSDDTPKVNFETDYPILRYYGNSTVTLYEWHHVAVTRQGSTFTFYLDGTEDGSFTDTKSFTTLEPVRISDQGNVDDERFTGTIDEVAICNRALTAEEMQGHYHNGLTGLGYLEASPHDVAVTHVTHYQNAIAQGCSVPINVTTENEGNYTETFNVTLYADTTAIDTLTNVTLTNGTSITVTFTWNTTDFAYGNYTIWAYAEPVPGETDTSDNLLIDGWILVTLPSDIALTNITTSKTNCFPVETAGERHNVTLYVLVQNQGGFTEAFNVTAYANSTAIGALPVTLNSGDNLTLTFIWKTMGFSYGNYTISATANTVQGEIDTTDNTINYQHYTLITIAGDVDGDRDVDIFDIVRMAGVYFVEKPDPRYDPNCDLDDDGDIDIFDIVGACVHYGESW